MRGQAIAEFGVTDVTLDSAVADATNARIDNQFQALKHLAKLNLPRLGIFLGITFLALPLFKIQEDLAKNYRKMIETHSPRSNACVS